MPGVHTQVNQYYGVNAHLHSLLQAEGTWKGFHNALITYLCDALSDVLLPLGYRADMEQSLQVHRRSEPPHLPSAGVLVSDTLSSRPRVVSAGSAPTLDILAILGAEIDDEAPYFAVAVRLRSTAGEPVAWFEVLSPSNKSGGLAGREYRAKRTELLSAGLVFVEIDYLHETPAAFFRFADYTRAESDSHPYRSAVIDPRPDLRHGYMELREFDVDDPIPTLWVLLSGSDAIEFDFALPYHETLRRGGRAYQIDYRELPAHFDRYSLEDRARIIRRMIAVLRAAAAGVDLDASAPLPPAAAPDLETLRALQESLAG
jgi:hypothetical protein